MTVVLESDFIAAQWHKSAEQKDLLILLHFCNRYEATIDTPMIHHYFLLGRTTSLHNDSEFYVQHFPNRNQESNPLTAGEVREITRTKALWEGNPISCVKSFGQLECSLCMQE